ncbi:MAG: DALR anticodon-binding domain-containing protein, partial [Bacteroidota bacterium]|nr:DALR anticodon-binding domain-containing protein [Bacteroidota bacterium]
EQGMQNAEQGVQNAEQGMQNVEQGMQNAEGEGELNALEKDILKLLYSFPSVVKEAGANYSPALIANYVYDLAREYNQFYQEIPVLRESDPQKKMLRLMLSEFTGKVIKRAMGLLGIGVPERM